MIISEIGKHSQYREWCELATEKDHELKDDIRRSRLKSVGFGLLTCCTQIVEIPTQLLDCLCFYYCCGICWNRCYDNHHQPTVDDRCAGMGQLGSEGCDSDCCYSGPINVSRTIGRFFRSVCGCDPWKETENSCQNTENLKKKRERLQPSLVDRSAAPRTISMC